MESIKENMFKLYYPIFFSYIIIIIGKNKRILLYYEKEGTKQIYSKINFIKI